MGLFSRLKDRLHKKEAEDIYDFRAHVLNEPQPFEEPKEPEPLEPLPVRSSFQEPDYSEPIIPRSRLKDLTVEPSYEPPKAFERAEEKAGRDYDILDRLSIIEAQLSAIRSQTETINERLKNMELRLGTRRI